MKIGIISEPNKKGQIVIPKEFRRTLGIAFQTPLNLVLKGEGFYVYPVERVLTKSEFQDTNKAYLEILKKTQGILGSKPYYKNEIARERLELTASRRRKRAW